MEKTRRCAELRWMSSKDVVGQIHSLLPACCIHGGKMCCERKEETEVTTEAADPHVSQELNRSEKK